MECPVKECLNNIEPECVIIEITKKPPIDKYHCSYYRDDKSKNKHNGGNKNYTS